MCSLGEPVDVLLGQETAGVGVGVLGLVPDLVGADLSLEQTANVPLDTVIIRALLAQPTYSAAHNRRY